MVFSYYVISLIDDRNTFGPMFPGDSVWEAIFWIISINCSLLLTSLRFVLLHVIVIKEFNLKR